MSGSSRGVVVGVILYASLTRSLLQHHSATEEQDEDDEEWGWDDEPEGGVELAKRNDDLRPRGPPFVSPSRAKTPPGQRVALTHRARSQDSSDPELDLSLPRRSAGRGRSPATSPASKPIASKKSSSLSTPMMPPPKPKPPKQEDDIFAELGLSAKPTFGKAAVSSSAVRSSAAPAATPAASSWNRAADWSTAVDDDNEDDANWDDDLDDLLED